MFFIFCRVWKCVDGVPLVNEKFQYSSRAKPKNDLQSIGSKYQPEYLKYNARLFRCSGQVAIL